MTTAARTAIGFALLVATPAALVWMRSATFPYTVVQLRGDRITLRNGLTLADATYGVAPQASIVRNGKPVRLDHIQIGDRVAFDTAQADGETPVVTVIAAQSPTTVAPTSTSIAEKNE